MIDAKLAQVSFKIWLCSESDDRSARNPAKRPGHIVLHGYAMSIILLVLHISPVATRHGY